MSSNTVQKRGNTNPQRPKRELNNTTSKPSLNREILTEKIVGVSWKAIIFLSLTAMFVFNFYMMKQMSSLKAQISEINVQANRDVKVVVDQKHNPNALEVSHFNQKIENFKGEILNKISEIKFKANVETVIRRRPASSPKYNRSAISEMGSIDVKKYTVQNPRSFPKYRRYLSEQSTRTRELRNRLSDIVKDFTSTHNIIGSDRSLYNQVLAFRDSVYNNHLDETEVAKENWKRIHTPRLVSKRY